LLSVVNEERARAGEAHAAWSESFNELFFQVAGEFGNAAVRRHGRAYLLGLLSQTERKNSWMLAEFAGDVSPDGLQRLLNYSPWDEDGCRDALSRYVVRHLGDPAAVLAVDETGFLKKGKMSAGVARMYTGTAGRVENCQVGVFLAYAAPDGSRALIDRELYLPEKWTADRDRCRAAGIGDEVAFATKPRLAETMIARAVAAGVPFSWVAGDEVYGGNPGLRGWLAPRLPQPRIKPNSHNAPKAGVGPVLGREPYDPVAAFCMTATGCLNEPSPVATRSLDDLCRLSLRVNAAASVRRATRRSDTRPSPLADLRPVRPKLFAAFPGLAASVGSGRGGSTRCRRDRGRVPPLRRRC
jgi:hypothetical protein